MEMEKINDDTIRVTLENEDLAKRHVTVLDLIGNHDEIEKFFYSILEEVDKDNQFADTDAVTFQMIPGKDGGLELLISKAKRNPATPDDAAMPLGDAQSQITETNTGDNDYEITDMKRLTELLSQENQANQQQIDSSQNDSKTYVYSQLQDLILANQLLPDGDLPAKLYLLDGKYYLCVSTHNQHGLVNATKDAMAILAEYGLASTLTEWQVAERGQLVMSGDVFSQLKRYF